MDVAPWIVGAVLGPLQRDYGPLSFGTLTLNRGIVGKECFRPARHVRVMFQDTPQSGPLTRPPP